MNDYAMEYIATELVNDSIISFIVYEEKQNQIRKTNWFSVSGLFYRMDKPYESNIKNYSVYG